MGASGGDLTGVFLICLTSPIYVDDIAFMQGTINAFFQDDVIFDQVIIIVT